MTSGTDPDDGAGRSVRRAAAGRRDRHGRGLRGPLVPPGVPLVRRRADRFDDLVVVAVARLRRAHPEALAPLGELEVVVTELPPATAVADPSAASVPLGAATAARPPRPARLVVHRRPVEARASSRRELEQLVQDVVTEQVAGLLDVDPEELDPDWPGR